MIRPCRADDVPAVYGMIRELAEYENAAHEINSTEEELRTALFGAQPVAFAHLAEDDATGGLLGFSLWYLTFSTWEGVGIHLEDIYVRPEARGSGLGKALLRQLAAICADRGYRRLEWWVLDWNEPSIGFFKSLGAVPIDELMIFRLIGDPLADLAGGRPAPDQENLVLGTAEDDEA
jgi:L-amino acid N-acyltransferase YncA